MLHVIADKNNVGHLWEHYVSYLLPYYQQKKTRLRNVALELVCFAQVILLQLYCRFTCKLLPLLQLGLSLWTMLTYMCSTIWLPGFKIQLPVCKSALDGLRLNLLFKIILDCLEIIASVPGGPVVRILHSRRFGLYSIPGQGTSYFLN